MRSLVIVLGIIYILSPLDLWPGFLDDMACLILMLFACAKLGGGSYTPSEDSTDSDSTWDFNESDNNNDLY